MQWILGNFHVNGWVDDFGDFELRLQVICVS